MMRCWSLLRRQRDRLRGRRVGGRRCRETARERRGEMRMTGEWLLRLLDRFEEMHPKNTRQQRLQQQWYAMRHWKFWEGEYWPEQELAREH
jgi:hypothetical protein